MTFASSPTTRHLRGADFNRVVRLRSRAGAPIDLSGHAVEVFEPHPALADLQAEIVDPPAGRIRLGLPFSPGWPMGSALHFRLRLRPLDGGPFHATPKITVILE